MPRVFRGVRIRIYRQGLWRFIRGIGFKRALDLMTRFVRIVGFFMGAALALHGCALATTGNRLFSTTTRGGSQHYWTAMVGAFGEKGAALVSGGFWFALGVVVIYLFIAPARKIAQEKSKSKRVARRRA